MTGCLLDTNVLSEMTRQSPDPRVLSFLGQETDLWLSTVVIYEVEYGLRLLPSGRRRDLLTATYDSITGQYADHVLPLNRLAAEFAAECRATAHRAGRVVDVGDALIAGTALAHDLAVATRNVSDFEGLGAEVINPWDTPSPR